ncbi:MAG TPA: response regulator transcription factor [Candidatus Saccharimonadales bacterium]|nr:response regulator transcription factor [Candidatus Saccharimonadales bacterium]
MRLLVIEDNRKIADTLKSALAAESYAVDVTYTGEEGLQAARYEPYDLIILDRMLPNKIDGITICKELRKEDIQVPILMLTAKDQVQQRVEGLEAGADDYLIKPFSLAELIARIRALLRRPHESLGTILTIGNLSLDTQAKQAQRGKYAIKLSATEYALLEYMMRNKGQILSKQNLINHVWDFDADIVPNTVETYINYLRAKIDKPFKTRPFIHTVHGFGYKMDTRP